ncbi:YdeI/OmpD-associated family protein [filamentous cyanobacterium LEGE 11480]|uniref:YdeI/OmpD-associated family protein n=1 Tax=Romeriopsis navalis LEGE 11480 TaxID=2777977 RepID=A0A928VJD3_9CYAN|nr:YdeI/OmpD-associated family protein [Romeriopsis navalis]MBE9028737.1 YdeI/OmpD-associated family protein [Romeriopsis navalis LEGE 11480]
MGKFDDQLTEVYAVDRAAWRQWLVNNHTTSPGVWLVYYKIKSGKSSIRYEEVVQECLCFGWIDSKTQSIDAERYRQIITPRKPGSVWSKVNKQYIEELIAAGLMTDAGLAKITAAKQDGSWTFLDDIEALIVPEDLAVALSSNRTAKTNFDNFSNTNQKNILYWIATAKRATTRLKRIEQTVDSAAQGRSPLEKRSN